MLSSVLNTGSLLGALATSPLYLAGGATNLLWKAAVGGSVYGFTRVTNSKPNSKAQAKDRRNWVNRPGKAIFKFCAAPTRFFIKFANAQGSKLMKAYAWIIVALSERDTKPQARTKVFETSSDAKKPNIVDEVAVEINVIRAASQPVAYGKELYQQMRCYSEHVANEFAKDMLDILVKAGCTKHVANLIKTGYTSQMSREKASV